MLYLLLFIPAKFFTKLVLGQLHDIVMAGLRSRRNSQLCKKIAHILSNRLLGWFGKQIISIGIHQIFLEWALIPLS